MVQWEWLAMVQWEWLAMVQWEWLAMVQPGPMGVKFRGVFQPHT
jgi:hypothetical protein